MRTALGLPQYQFVYAAEDKMSPIEEQTQVALIDYIGQIRRTTSLFTNTFYTNIGNSHGQDIVRAAHYLAREAAAASSFPTGQVINVTGVNTFANVQSNVCNMDFRHQRLQAHGRFGLVNINHELDVANVHDVLSGFCATNVTVIGVYGQTVSELALNLETDYPYVLGQLWFNVIYSSCVGAGGDQLGFYCVYIFAHVAPLLSEVSNGTPIQVANLGTGCLGCCGSVACTYVTITNNY